MDKPGIIHPSVLQKSSGYFRPNKKTIMNYSRERDEYNQRSIIVINSLNGEIYPVSIDAYSGNNATPEGKINFSLSSNKLCIEGDILVYRSMKSGVFCFFLEKDKFSGYSTAYME